MKKKWVYRGIFLAILCVSAIWLAPKFRHISAQSILAYTPNRPVLAALFLLVLFVGKSLSFFFPLAVLEAASGLLFPLPAALAVNLLGVTLSMSVPWLMGRREQEGLDTLTARYPRLAGLRSFRQENRFEFVFLLRLVGVLPFDVVSLYLGSAGIPYRAYLVAGLLGDLPHMAAVTVLGSALSDPASRAFRISLAANIAISAAALMLCKFRKTGRSS
ncbi:MAG: VTT domain-containing protein [Oscillibacter sp.]|nr:VTT domain-containing protein [Oscillibacter sp.]